MISVIEKRVVVGKVPISGSSADLILNIITVHVGFFMRQTGFRRLSKLFMNDPLLRQEGRGCIEGRSFRWGDVLM